MDPITIITLVEEAIKLTPDLIAGFQRIFASGNPTPADFAALRAQVLAKTYKDYVPASVL